MGKTHGGLTPRSPSSLSAGAQRPDRISLTAALGSADLRTGRRARPPLHASRQDGPYGLPGGPAEQLVPRGEQLAQRGAVPLAGARVGADDVELVGDGEFGEVADPGGGRPQHGPGEAVAELRRLVR